MKPRAGIVSLLLGLALLPGGLAAAEEGVAAQPPKTRMHRQLNQLIRQDVGTALPAVSPVADEPADVAPGTLQLEPMIVEEPKLKDLPPPETKAEKFFRTGTIWEKAGRKFTQQIWVGRGQGIGYTLAW